MEHNVRLDKATPSPLPTSSMANNHSAEASYGIIDWFGKCLRNYFNFSGRARRKEYWYFMLVYVAIIIVAAILDSVIFNTSTGWFYVVTVLGLFFPSVAVTIRRLHDSSHSGWWFLVSLVPLIGIVLIVYLVRETKFEINQWGPPAK